VKTTQDKLFDLVADLGIEAKPAGRVLDLTRAVLQEPGRNVSDEGDRGEEGGTARRTRAVSAFFSARPAALRTNTGLASLASSEASVCMYPGCVRRGEHESTKGGKKGWDGGGGFGGTMYKTFDAHSSPGMPALVFEWHFHA
jgi:hypothetical protein